MKNKWKKAKTTTPLEQIQNVIRIS